MVQTFPISACPKALCVHTWLARLTKLNKNIIESDITDVEIDINLDIEKLKQSLLNQMEIHKPVGWQTKDTSVNFYKSLSITSNPNHQDDIDENVSSIGTPKNSTGEFYYNQIKNHKFLRDSYYDTYGFTKLTDIAKQGELGKLISKIKRTIIRSRISTIEGSSVPIDNETGWHRDESIFINLRLNIPITTSDEFFFEMKDVKPYNLKLGKLYSWDTNIPHRVSSHTTTDNNRTHLVIGVSPWYDYNKVSNAWTPNEFFGKKHPFDMLYDGDIISNDIFNT
jgi:hypothetical protein